MQGQTLASIASIAARSRMDATGSGNGTIGIRGVRVLPMPGIAEWLTRYGYAEINAELTAESAYDAQSGRIDLSSFRIAGRDVGVMPTISLLMDGLTQQAMLDRNFNGLRLFGASLGWLDQSILAARHPRHGAEHGHHGSGAARSVGRHGRRHARPARCTRPGRPA